VFVLALYLWECKNFVWLFEHMLLLVKCVGFISLVQGVYIFKRRGAYVFFCRCL
jgi:hypothetical protein